MKVVFRKNNKSAPEIVAHIEANPLCTTAEIATALGRPLRSVENMINRLLAAGLIHIEEWERLCPGSGRPARLFVAGPGENAKRPAPTKIERRKQKSEWQRKKRAGQHVMQQAAASHGVFGVLIAQIRR